MADLARDYRAARNQARWLTEVRRLHLAHREHQKALSSIYSEYRFAENARRNLGTGTSSLTNVRAPTSMGGIRSGGRKDVITKKPESAIRDNDNRLSRRWTGAPQDLLGNPFCPDRFHETLRAIRGH